MDFFGNTAPQPGFRNLIINGNFAINQRGYASGAAVGASAYCLDRWRDGNGGSGSPSGFTFTAQTTGSYKATSPVDVVVTVPAGSTIQQPIEPLCLAAASQPYTLSWIGTAAGQYEWYDGSNYHVVSGASPLTITIPPNVSALVQFTNGTVSQVQLEAGTTPTPFERRHPALEAILCQRYFRRLGATLAYRRFGTAVGISSTQAYLIVSSQRVDFRAAPTISYGGSLVLYNANSFPVTSMATDNADLQASDLLITASGGGLTSGGVYQLSANNDATAHIDLSAEL